VEVPKGLPDIGEARVKIVNFGLGIKEIDREKIFEWGVRLVPGHSKFQEIYGKGIGLWEVKHIIEGHGGKISVESVHFTKAPVTDQNIQQCITVFTVSLPTAIKPHELKGG
jgi:signal transduction histidine kinase